MEQWSNISTDAKKVRPTNDAGSELQDVDDWWADRLVVFEQEFKCPGVDKGILRHHEAKKAESDGTSNVTREKEDESLG